MSDEVKIISRFAEPKNGCLAFVIDCNGERGTVRIIGGEMFMDMDFWEHRDKIAGAIMKLTGAMFTSRN
jgi:hypothetical protein